MYNIFTWTNHSLWQLMTLNDNPVKFHIAIKPVYNSIIKLKLTMRYPA